MTNALKLNNGHIFNNTESLDDFSRRVDQIRRDWKKAGCPEYKSGNPEAERLAKEAFARIISNI